MASPPRQMKLGLFLMGSGHHLAGWRHPDALAAGDLDFDGYRRIVQAAERAKFDLAFLADGLAMRDLGGPEGTSRADYWPAHLDPLTLLPALAAVTTRIGLVATASTTYYEPYHVARKFASLDHISKGRAGWNLVTSDSAQDAANFSRPNWTEHDLRYERARDFVDVVTGLWDSWEDEAWLRDKASGRYFDPARVHALAHSGAHFSVRGPLNVPRPPQGHPVIVQAGSSGVGQALAAATADVAFTAQTSFAQAQKFYAGLKAQAAAAGRDPDTLKIMPGLFPIVGESEAAAQDKLGDLEALVHPEAGLGMLTSLLGGFDLSGYPLDGPVPEPPPTNGGQSRQELLVAMARRENLTIRQLYLRNAAARGHLNVLGTPAQIADRMEHWLREGAADGFNLMPPYLPGAFDDFVALVLPELRRRGLFRSDYEGATLRDHLGLPRPRNRFAPRA